MPTPARTSVDAIVNAGRDILDLEGLDALTMQRVAGAVGVRAPSLYKRVRDRDALVRLIAADVVDELAARVRAAAGGAGASGADPATDAAADLRAIARTFRGWALEHPGGYALLFSRLPDAWRLEPDADPTAGVFAALFRSVAALSGPDDVLEASRTVVAWASGFVGMELAGAFRLGGDVDSAFEYGVERIVTAIRR
jgi:AcrR family transcriptional regulator